MRCSQKCSTFSYNNNKKKKRGRKKKKKNTFYLKSTIQNTQAKGPAPHGGKIEKRREGSEAARWSSDLNQIRLIWKGKVGNDLKCVQKNFYTDAMFNRSQIKTVGMGSN